MFAIGLSETKCLQVKDWIGKLNIFIEINKLELNCFGVWTRFYKNRTFFNEIPDTILNQSLSINIETLRF